MYPVLSSNEASGTGGRTAIQHVVLLILENRSFDQIFGYRSSLHFPLKVNGVATEDKEKRFNLDSNGAKIYQNPIKAFTGEDDSTHDLAATLYCINGTDGKSPMSGFVLANQLKIKDPDNGDNTIPIPPNEIMGYFPQGSFPLFDYIGDHFLICDNWFAAAPSSTLPNRAFGLCAQCDGHINNRHKDGSGLFYKCPTIFDKLAEKNVSSRVYYNDYALSLTLENQVKIERLANYKKFTKFASDVASGDLPAFTFIEPEYGIESSADKIDGVFNGQLLVKEILVALQSNPELWESTLFAVYYDESGGFYDHVYPPMAPSPGQPPAGGYPFNQLGVRVPAMLISPRLPRGVDSTVYDHTSLLKFIELNWDLNPLSNRDRSANHFLGAILPKPRNDFPSVKTVSLAGAGVDTTIRNRKNDKAFFLHLVENNLTLVLTTIGKELEPINFELHQLLTSHQKKYKGQSQSGVTTDMNKIDSCCVIL